MSYATFRPRVLIIRKIVQGKVRNVVFDKDIIQKKLTDRKEIPVQSTNFRTH